MTFGQPQASSGLSLNLSQSGAPLTNGYATNNTMPGITHQGYTAPAQNWYAQGQQQPSAASALFAGFTGQDPYNPQPMMPPSETEILMTMLDQQYSVERFLASPLFGSILDIMNTITTFSLLNVMKNATYTFDEENGVFSLDTSTLPQELQTMSAENIMAQVTALNAQLGQLIAQADAIKQQTMQNAGNSMLQAQLANAMADPGLMTGAAEAGGSFMRNLMFGGRA
tara:strand:- start:1727 stop:2404 length:678 start_codon:yes stop_codon:yes gene_type:complete